MTTVYKVTLLTGDSCHFGNKATAMAYAKGTGTVESIELADPPKVKNLNGDTVTRAHFGGDPFPMLEDLRGRLSGVIYEYVDPAQ